MAGWVGGGMGPLRATSAHVLAPSDLSKHETLLSSFSRSERRAKREKKGLGMKREGRVTSFFFVLLWQLSPCQIRE